MLAAMNVLSCGKSYQEPELAGRLLVILEYGERLYRHGHLYADRRGVISAEASLAKDGRERHGFAAPAFRSGGWGVGAAGGEFLGSEGAMAVLRRLGISSRPKESTGLCPVPLGQGPICRQADHDFGSDAGVAVEGQAVLAAVQAFEPEICVVDADVARFGSGCRGICSSGLFALSCRESSFSGGIPAPSSETIKTMSSPSRQPVIRILPVFFSVMRMPWSRRFPPGAGRSAWGWWPQSSSGTSTTRVAQFS